MDRKNDVAHCSSSYRFVLKESKGDIVDESLESARIFELSSERIGGVARPLRNDKDRILAALEELSGQKISGERGVDVVPPSVYMNNEINRIGGSESSGDEHGNSAVVVVFLSGEKLLAVSISRSPSWMRKGSR
jgi:hypothetical protein